MAVMGPSKVMGREGIGSVMTALTGELHAKQRRLNEEEDRTAYTLATDGDLFRFFRMTKEGQPAETQCRSGNNYQDSILLLVTVFDDDFIPPGTRMISPTTPGDTTGKTTHADLQIVDRLSSRALCQAPISQTKRKPPQYL
ncbi:hypothetical protein HAV15_002758 [Penicillium sp. str. |nr:hypothetical protein HAV15_002758 [Penicillium sp. str. \